jgi:pantoate--beta-alanine ligase
MLIIKDISNLQKYLEAYRSNNKTLGYVPTMGALHDGHKALINQSQKENNKTIVSIFVNEKQFNDKKDFVNYPRNRGADYDFCEDNNVDIIFEPDHEEIYPSEIKSTKNKFYTGILCDLYRPGHFDGVVTVLNRFFSIVDSNRVYFGEKDFQQLKIVSKLIEEKFKNLTLVPVQTVRMDSGIPLSSRNQKLSKKQFDEYNLFQKALLDFIKTLDKSLKINELKVNLKNFLTDQKIEKYDYFEFRNSNDLSEEGKLSDAKLFYAIYKGQIRLIDNIEI